MDYAILKAELTNDPLTRGYAGMTDHQVADSLNVVNRTLPNDTIPAYIFYDNMLLSEYVALSADNKQLLGMLFSMGTMSIKAGQTRNALLAMFPAGSTTRANLAPLQTRPVSRADELGLGFIYAGYINSARAT